MFAFKPSFSIHVTDALRCPSHLVTAVLSTDEDSLVNFKLFFITGFLSFMHVCYRKPETEMWKLNLFTSSDQKFWTMEEVGVGWGGGGGGIAEYVNSAGVDGIMFRVGAILFVWLKAGPARDRWVPRAGSKLVSTENGCSLTFRHRASSI
jgi:hypothetical protein